MVNAILAEGGKHIELSHNPAYQMPIIVILLNAEIVGINHKEASSFTLPVYKSSSVAEGIKPEESPTSVLIWLDSREKAAVM